MNYTPLEIENNDRKVINSTYKYLRFLGKYKYLRLFILFIDLSVFFILYLSPYLGIVRYL